MAWTLQKEVRMNFLRISALFICIPICFYWAISSRHDSKQRLTFLFLGIVLLTSDLAQKEKHESATSKIGSGAFIQMPFLSRLAQTISAKDAGLYAIERIGFYRQFSDSNTKCIRRILCFSGLKSCIPHIKRHPESFGPKSRRAPYSLPNTFI